MRKNKCTTLPNWNADEISLNSPFQWKLDMCVYCSSCSSPFFVFFINQTQNMTIHVLETQQTHQPKTMKPKLYESNPCEKKKSNPSNPATDQTIKPNKQNRSNGSTQQTESIKPSKPTADQPIHRHRVPINPSNSLPINPSTTTEFPNQTHQTRYRSTHQTHRRSTHPPPPSSQIKKLKH